MKAGLIAACLLMSALPVAAQDFVEIDLDGRAPAERVYVSGNEINVLVWNPDRAEWIDIFRAPGDADALRVGPIQHGSLASLTIGGREWGWRGSRYVPLPPLPDMEGGAPAEAAQAAFRAAGSTLTAPAGLGFAYREPDGSVSYFVPVEDPAICSSWLCGGAVVRGGVASLDIGAIIGDRIGPSHEVSAQGYRMIEQISEDGELLVMDPDDIDIDTKIIPGMAVRVAHPQPASPED